MRETKKSKLKRLTGELKSLNRKVWATSDPQEEKRLTAQINRTLGAILKLEGKKLSAHKVAAAQ